MKRNRYQQKHAGVRSEIESHLPVIEGKTIFIKKNLPTALVAWASSGRNKTDNDVVTTNISLTKSLLPSASLDDTKLESMRCLTTSIILLPIFKAESSFRRKKRSRRGFLFIMLMLSILYYIMLFDVAVFSFCPINWRSTTRKDTTSKDLPEDHKRRIFISCKHTRYSARR